MVVFMQGNSCDCESLLRQVKEIEHFVSRASHTTVNGMGSKSKMKIKKAKHKNKLPLPPDFIAKSKFRTASESA